MDSDKIFEEYTELLFLAGENITPLQNLILYLHAANLASGLKCTGKNEDDPESDYVIPLDWNKSEDDVYSIRYKNPKNNETIYFKFIEEKNLLDVNAVRFSKTGRIYSNSISMNDIKKFDKESLEKIRMKYQKDILDGIFDVALKKDDRKQVFEPIRREPKPEYPDNPNPFWRPPQNPLAIGPRSPFGDYGSSDLRPVPNDPFGEKPTGQGNLFGPNNPFFIYGPHSGGMGLTKPPGARFDPYGPDDITPFKDEKPKRPPGGNGFGPGSNSSGSGFGGLGGGFGGGGFGGGGGFWG